MDKKASFKEFVKKNPILVKYVNDNKMTWQKFYEMYDLYGEDNDIWKTYITNEEKNNTSLPSTLALTDIVAWLKNIDIDKMQESIGSVQRVLGVLEDLGNNKTESKTTYKPRPLYKHFED